MTHFTDIELHRWRDGGPGQDRERVVEHLAVCSQCAGRYAAAIRNRPRRQTEAAADVADFKKEGLRVGARRSYLRRWALSIAAAAVIILVVAIPVSHHRDATIPDLHLRGGNVVALAPAGVVEGPDIDFAWSSALSAPRYRVEIGRGPAVIYVSEANRNRFSLPQATRDSLQPNVEYWWTVTALDSSGGQLAKSARRMFVIAPR